MCLPFGEDILRNITYVCTFKDRLFLNGIHYSNSQFYCLCYTCGLKFRQFNVILKRPNKYICVLCNTTM